MSRLRAWLLDEASAGCGSFVMATGIVCIGISLSDHQVVAEALLALCALGWLVLAAAILSRLLARRRAPWLEATQLGALTTIAGTMVLGGALHVVLGWRLVPLVLWTVGATLWLVVMSRVVSTFPPRPPSGPVFLLTVATQGVSLLAASLAVAYTTSWLVDARLVLAAKAQGPLAGIVDELEIAVTVIWVVAIAILVVLVCAELAHPRLGYSALRWATAFPVGMYAACSFVASDALGQPWMARSFADWWVWVGLGVWAIVGAGLARRIAWLVSGRTLSRQLAAGD